MKLVEILHMSARLKAGDEIYCSSVRPFLYVRNSSNKEKVFLLNSGEVKKLLKSQRSLVKFVKYLGKSSDFDIPRVCWRPYRKVLRKLKEEERRRDKRIIY